MNYAQERITDETQRAQDLYTREARRREEQKKAQEEKIYQAQLSQYRQATQAVTEGNGRIADAQKLLQQWSRYTENAQRTLNELAEAGFIPPAPVAPAVNPNPSIIAKPTPKAVTELEREDIYTVAERITCEVCGTENVVAACAYHKLDLGEGMYCIRDEKRARSSGLNPVLIESNLVRQRAVAQLAESEVEPTTFDSELVPTKSKKSRKQ